MYLGGAFQARVHLCTLGVIPNQFSKSLDATDSELDETWYVSSACGFMKPDKISLLYIVWFPGYDPSKIPLFFNYC